MVQYKYKNTGYIVLARSVKVVQPGSTCTSYSIRYRASTRQLAIRKREDNALGLRGPNSQQFKIYSNVIINFVCDGIYSILIFSWALSMDGAPIHLGSREKVTA
jgi:hypothetical protein